MASASGPTSTIHANSSGTLHPILLGISKAMREADQERKERLDLAQEFFAIIDAWAKSQGKTSTAAIVTPFIDSITPVVTTFAIGTAQTQKPPCKSQLPVESIVTIPWVTNTSVAPNILLPRKLQENKSSWVTIARKAAKLPVPPVASISRKHTGQTNNTP